MKTANNKLLIQNEHHLFASPLLSKTCGYAAAALIQKLHFCLASAKHVHNGKNYWYATYENLAESLNCFSIPTLKRAVKKLKEKGFLLVEQLGAKTDWTQTNYYSIDYAKLNEFVSQQSTVTQKVVKKAKVAFDHVVEIVKKPFTAKESRPRAKIESPAITFSGTSEATIKITPEQIHALTFEMKYFFKTLRQQRVDIATTDPRLPLLFKYEKQVMRHVSYWKQASSTPFGWHTPEQLKLEKFTTGES